MLNWTGFQADPQTSHPQPRVVDSFCLLHVTFVWASLPVLSSSSFYMKFLLNCCVIYTCSWLMPSRRSSQSVTTLMWTGGWGTEVRDRRTSIKPQSSMLSQVQQVDMGLKGPWRRVRLLEASLKNETKVIQVSDTAIQCHERIGTPCVPSLALRATDTLVALPFASFISWKCLAGSGWVGGWGLS